MKRALAAAAVAAACHLSLVARVVAAPQSFDAAWQAAMPSYYAALLASARGDADGTTRQLLLFGARVKELAGRSDSSAWAMDPGTGERITAAVAARVEEARQRTLRRDLPGAHASLERVRYLLRDARARQSVRTFDDAITDYHEAMERLTSHVGLHNEILLGPADYQDIRDQAIRASAAWTEISTRASAQKALPGWREVAGKTTTLLDTLQQAVGAKNADLAQTTSEALKANYYSIIGVLARATS